MTLGTRVFVARVGRQTKTREYKDLEAHFTANLGYSHHQKAVIVDAPIEGASSLPHGPGEPNGGSCSSNLERRRLIAYIGGIDLTGNCS